ncbi:MAG: hypothetical protein NTX40_00135 [Planctomycetota bacterium]|nr:hypothetical protein [Planctomycetota bacterium]
MRERTQRRLLWTLSATLGLGLVAAVLGLGVLPVEFGPATADAPGLRGEALAPRQVEPLSAFAAIFERDLRRPLYDPSPAAKADPPPPPRPQVDLVGTAVEPGYTYAFLKTGGGKVKMVGLGQEADGVKVTAIAVGAATIEFQGRTYALEVQKKEAPR